MNRKKISIRFNLDEEKDAAAWSYIHRNGIPVNQAVIDAICSTMSKPWDKEFIQEAIRSVLREMNFTMEPHGVLTEENDDAVSNFLDSF